MRDFKNRLFRAHYSWKSLFAATILSAFAYVFFEWLFLVTKPSFFSAATFVEKFRVGLFTAALLAALCALPLVALWGLSVLLRGARSLLLSLGALVPAGLLACLALLLIDNFTYTVFQFGIITSVGVFRAAYLLLLVGLMLAIYLDLKKDLAGYERLTIRRRAGGRVLLGLVVLSAAALLLNYERPQSAADAPAARAERGSLPNILLITADGLNAANTSIYSGFERDTTPIIAGLAKKSLLAENAFNNSGKTMGSAISIYTSKYPTETRTLHSPDILKGEDAYQHLPNILKRFGYYNIQYAHVYHVDAFTENMLSSFEEVNGKTLQSSRYQNWLNENFSTNYAYFIYELANRIVDRLRHITFNKRMPTRQEVSMGEGQLFNDQAKVNRILKAIRTSDRPVFAHLHWMGTHGGKFNPTHRVFSKDKDAAKQADWDPDFYDDAILDFDSGVGQIIASLKKMGAWENTVLIVSTDHSQEFLTNQRIPLLMHFPGDQYQRQVATNVQLMDIAPTVLEYLRVAKPAWMRGTSFLTADPAADRPIIGVGVRGVNKTELINAGVEVDENDRPPFYQFGYISVVYCGTYYELDLDKYRWEKSPVAGYRGTCAEVRPAADQSVFDWMRGRLAADGFDISSLASFSPVAQSNP